MTEVVIPLACDKVATDVVPFESTYPPPVAPDGPPGPLATSKKLVMADGANAAAVLGRPLELLDADDVMGRDHADPRVLPEDLEQDDLVGRVQAHLAVDGVGQRVDELLV